MTSRKAATEEELRNASHGPLETKPVHHPPEDLCSSQDHDRSCFSLMGWADVNNVAQWLGIQNVYKVECQSLGANISGSFTREMDIITKTCDEGEEKRIRLVRKIGVHDKGLGRCREAVFYLQFNPPTNSVPEILANAERSPLKRLRNYIPRCYFAHFDNTSELKEKMAIVIERIDGVDSGYFFGRHSPLNWKFSAQDDMDKLLQPWTEHGIDERFVALETARIASTIHGPFWNKVNDELLHDSMMEHAARKDLYEIVFDKTKTGDEAAPSFWVEAINRAKAVWDAEKTRILGLSTNSGDSETPVESPMLKIERSADGEERPNSKVTPFGFSQLVTDCLDASFEKTTWKNVLAELRSIPATFVHGDFHPANMVVAHPVKNEASGKFESKVYLVDYEMFGFGSGPQELGQYMISHCRPETRKTLEKEALEKYIAHLQEDYGVATKSEDEVNFIRSEYVRGGLGRWFWFLPILMNLGQDKNFRKYFHDQVYYFLLDHGVTAANAPLIRV
jgi:hypothetical protein